MVATSTSITVSSRHPRNEDISRIQLALRYVKRQIHLIDESVQSILWLLRKLLSMGRQPHAGPSTSGTAVQVLPSVLCILVLYNHVDT
jgi:hypothetical protein